MAALNDAIVILSLSICMPLFGVYIETLLMWSGLAKESFLNGENDPPGGRLARGIFVGFAADTLDNFYWFLTWLLVLLEHELGLTMMLGGSAANVVFRQGLGLWAGYEHVNAAQQHHGNSYNRHVFDKYYWTAALVVAAVLIYFNDWSAA